MPAPPRNPHDHVHESFPRRSCDDGGAVAAVATHESGRFSVTLAGELDLVTKPCLTQVLHDFRASNQSGATVDLTAATFIDTTCLTFLALLRQTALERRGAVAIRGAAGMSRRTLALVGFDTIFDVVH